MCVAFRALPFTLPPLGFKVVTSMKFACATTLQLLKSEAVGSRVTWMYWLWLRLAVYRRTQPPMFESHHNGRARIWSTLLALLDQLLENVQQNEWPVLMHSFSICSGSNKLKSRMYKMFQMRTLKFYLSSGQYYQMILCGTWSWCQSSMSISQCILVAFWNVGTSCLLSIAQLYTNNY